MVRRYSDLQAIFPGVSGPGYDTRHSQQVDRGYTKSFHTRGFWRQRSNAFAGTWALHRQDCASAGDVVAADDGAHAIGVGCVRHHVKHVRAQPPHDDVVTHPALFVARVCVLRATRCDLAQVVGEFTLQQVECVSTGYSHSAKMRHVKHRGIGATSHVFGDGSCGIRQRHFPPAEGNHFGAELTVQGVKRRKTVARHGVTARRCATVRQQNQWLRLHVVRCASVQ